MSFDCFFSLTRIDHEIWINDDDRVCYAYVFDAEGKICGQVWLYNRVPAPRKFEDGRGIAPRNPAPYVADTNFLLPRSADEFSVQWYQASDLHYAKILVRATLVAILAPGTLPGWSVLAKKNGPVARVLRPSSRSNLEAINRDLRDARIAERGFATGTGAESEPRAATRERGDIMEEMTATDHRARENFRKNHPHPERRIPKAERRRVRIEHQMAWKQDREEGRFDHLPRLAPKKKNRPRERSGRRMEMGEGATVDEVLRAIADDLHGTTATDSDIRLLRARLTVALVPDWLVDALKRYNLAGTDFSLTEEQDLSGLGADVVWMTPKQMIKEACDFEPGFTIVRSGFLPFGACSVGTGDPFFFDLRDASDDPPVVRVPHDYAGGESYPLDAIELVAPSLTAFLRTANIG